MAALVGEGTVAHHLSRDKVQCYATALFVFAIKIFCFFPLRQINGPSRKLVRFEKKNMSPQQIEFSRKCVWGISVLKKTVLGKKSLVKLKESTGVLCELRCNFT